MGGLNWEKINRQKRVDYRPALRTQPATQKQLDYILILAYQKAQPRPRLPKTKKGARDLIERLLVLPDVNVAEKLAPEDVKVETRPTTTQETVVELRERFPQLTPMTAMSLVQLFGQIDATGMAFVLDGLMTGEAPEDADELILFILRRFLAEFSDITLEWPRRSTI